MKFRFIHPDLYHRHKNKKNYFEGWYFKLTDQNNSHPLALIPGIIHGKTGREGHAFIQVLNGKEQSSYVEFPKDQFFASKHSFEIGISKNEFSLKECKLNLNTKELKLTGTLQFNDIIPWPDSLINPGSMGFYNYLWFMECYSQVCALGGTITGALTFQGETIDYTGGKLYIEKNWGRRFPESYIWVQASGFDDPGILLTLSVARVPFPVSYFNGFLAAFVYKGKVYRFTTMNKSKMKLNIIDNQVQIILERSGFQLVINTYGKASDYLSIKGPKNGAMSVTVRESIASEISVTWLDMNSGKVLYAGKSRNSGIELMGDLTQLQ